MTERRTLPYGSWPSPIAIETVVAGSISLQQPRLRGSDVYWTEGRPKEGGRQVIVRWNEKEGVADVNPPPFNARTMAHEYGGGWYAIGDHGVVYYSNLPDGRIYRQAPGDAPQALTVDGPYRYGDLVFDSTLGRLLCVREDWTSVEPGALNGDGRVLEPPEALVAVNVDDGSTTVLEEGYDFYSTPRPVSGRLAWIAWRHPNMPWDATELWIADVDGDGLLAGKRMVVGGPDESVIQPEWAPDGSLVFVSDRSGWWNLYRWQPATERIDALLPMQAEFAGPQWIFGMSWYGVAGDGTIVAATNRGGTAELWAISADGSSHRIQVPDAIIGSLQASSDAEHARVCYVSGSSVEPRSIVLLELDTGARRVLRRSFELEADSDYISQPRAIEFPTTHGHTAHALFYPPTNPDCRAPEGERPPLVVTIHGGPTSAASGALNLETQAFTSRGFAVVDVNYRGSSGYGRQYMRLLDGQWGVYDIEDCLAAARYLADRGDVDGDRMAIRGGSAGGYTTLAALAFHDVFRAGASHFGVGDLEDLARYTHKFESHYLDRLVAPYPEGVAVYRERSPIYAVDRIRVPLLVLQGRDDQVVSIAQAEQIVAALEANEIPYAYLAFDGEGHGFRHAANIRRALEAELSFYAQVFDFQLADGIEPVQVEHLARSKGA